MHPGSTRGVGDGARHCTSVRALPASTASSVYALPSRWSSRTAYGHPRHARDRPGSLSRRPERRAPPQHRPSATGTLLCFLIAWLVGEALFLREVRPIIATARKVSAGDLEARTASVTSAANCASSAHIDDAVAAQQHLIATVAAREEAVEANRAKDRSSR